MTGADLPDELARLEHALRTRALPLPTDALRTRTLGRLRRTRRRERWTMLAAAAAVLAVALVLRGSPAEIERGLGTPLVHTERLELEAFGLAGAALRDSTLAMGRARVPRIAPLMGSMGAADGTGGL